MAQEFANYIKYIDERENYWAPCATRSRNAILFDGTTIEERYSKILESNERLDIDRYRFRTPFQLDRDRILYSPIFLRLSQKTQLLTSKKGLIENRFTHTVRVVQISKSICYGLKLNQDLAEAIAFGHDVGHTPFAHMGERTLNNWLAEHLPKSKQAELPGMFKDSTPPPPAILLKIEPTKRNLFTRSFTVGNDPNEKFFMHGRQSFRFLTFKHPPWIGGYPDYVNFAKPVLFGIWRHSYEDNMNTDFNFSYSIELNEGIHGKICYDDLTPEAQTVRIADDIAWAVTDLFEGLREGLVKVENIRKSLNGLAPGEDILPLSRSQIIDNFETGTLSPIYTHFISDVININMERVNQTTQRCSLEMSDPIKSDLKALMNLVRNKIHIPSPVGRADKIHEAMIKSLCDWYYENPKDLIIEIKSLRLKKDFPFEEAPEEIISDDMARLSVIVDFVSLLTDEEVYILSESLPFRIYF